MRDGRTAGFTLVEIMMVVAIMTLLAAFAIPNVLRGRTTANESATISNLRSLVSSLEMYRSINNAYPDNAAGAWQTDMYVTPTPDFGPVQFNVPMTGQNVSGFSWTYTGVALGPTFTIDSVPTTVGRTGTRRFRADQQGILRHCMCPNAACVNLGAAAWANEAQVEDPPSNCG